MRQLSFADYFVEFLIVNGITDVFGYQGGMIAYIFDSLGRYNNQINYHLCATEQGAALAACGYAQASGKPGVAISTSGPGFTNLVTGIANAWFDSIPVLFISGNVNTKDKKRNLPLRQLGFQEIQASSMAESVTKNTFEFELDTNYPDALNNAYRTAFSDRKGPVYIDLPINVCREMVEFETIEPVIIDKPESSDISIIINELLQASKPLIIAGAGIHQSGMKKQFRELIELLDIPVITTLPGVDMLPSGSRNMLGYIGGTARREAGIALQNADFVLSLGTRLCSKQIGHNLSLFAPKAKKIIRVDADESEFERKLNENEIQYHGYLQTIIPDMLSYFKVNEHKLIKSLWTDSCAKMHTLLKEYDLSYGNKIIMELTRYLPEDTNIVIDVGKNMTYCGQSAEIKNNTKLYMSAGLGTMGYSIPAAIGAYYGNGHPTVVITGDGGAQMNIQELNTIIKNDLPIKIVVLNNRALGNIRIFQEQYLDSRYVGTQEENGDYFSCNFSAIGKAYGLKSITITKLNEFEKYKALFFNHEAVLFEVIFDDCPVYPGIVAGGNFLNNDIDNDVLEQIIELMS